jgi:glycosyltransferase involved in cell wall biosynthesis
MLDHPDVAASLGTRARAEAEARYSFDRMVGAFEDLYRSELTRRGVIETGQPQLAAS